MNVIWHQFADFLRIIGMRDRLQCPNCLAVGTWKPHGGWLDIEDKRKVRRWLCKWCGFYHGPELVKQCELGPTVWRLYYPNLDIRLRYRPDAKPDTPANRCNGANPWRG